MAKTTKSAHLWSNKKTSIDMDDNEFDYGFTTLYATKLNGVFLDL